MKLGMTIGGYLAGLAYLWVAFYFGGKLLPDGWMSEWYGFPTYMSLVAGAPAVVIFGMWVGDCCIGDVQP